MLVVDKNRYQLRFRAHSASNVCRGRFLDRPANVLDRQPFFVRLFRGCRRGTQIPANSCPSTIHLHTDAFAPSNSWWPAVCPTAIASVRRSAGPTCRCRIGTLIRVIVLNVHLQPLAGQFLLGELRATGAKPLVPTHHPAFQRGNEQPLPKPNCASSTCSPGTFFVPLPKPT